MFTILDKIERNLSFKSKLISLGTLALMLISFNAMLINSNHNLGFSNEHVLINAEDTEANNAAIVKDENPLAMVSIR